MAASSAYYSRELSFLQKAQNALKDAGEKCSTVATNNVSFCTRLVSDPLMKFANAWEAQTSTFNNKRDFAEGIQLALGNLGGGFKHVGLIPFLIIVTFGWFAVYSVFISKNSIVRSKLKGDAMWKNVQRTIVLVLAFVVIQVVIFPLFWTYGLMAKYEVKKLNASLHSGDSAGVFNNPTFGKIYSGCMTAYLKHVYNCAHGLDVNANVDDATGSTCTQMEPVFDKDSSTNEAKHVASGSAKMADGLNALLLSNIDDFDMSAVTQNIARGITDLRKFMSPMSTSSKKLSMMDILQIIDADILPVLKQDRYTDGDVAYNNFIKSTKDTTLKDTTNEDTTSKDTTSKDTTSKAATWLNDNSKDASVARFTNDMETVLVPKVTSVLFRHWPQLNLDMHMEHIDDALSDYYTASYYEENLRENVLTVFHNAMSIASKSTSNDGKLATVSQFETKNWIDMQTKMSSVRKSVADLYTNIDRFIESFMPSNPVSKSLGSEIMVMFVNHGIAIITLLVLIYVINLTFGMYFDRGSRTVVNGATRDTMTMGSFILQEKWKWIDYLKKMMLAIAATMFTVSVLFVIRKKKEFRVKHNNDALFGNSVRLKTAAWNLFTVLHGEGYCKDVTSNEPAGLTACNKYMADQNITKDQIVGEDATKTPGVAAGTTAGKEAASTSTTIDAGLLAGAIAGAKKGAEAMANVTAIEEITNGSTTSVATENVKAAAERGAEQGAAAGAFAGAKRAGSSEKSATDAVDKSSAIIQKASADVIDTASDIAKKALEDAIKKTITTTKSNGVVRTQHGQQARRFYSSAVELMEAYSRCNFVTKNIKVPFPLVESIVVLLLILVCIGICMYLTGMTTPVSKIRELRGLLRLRTDLSHLTTSVPSSIQQRIKSQISCGDTTTDVLTILVFVSVIIMFVLNAILVSSFSKSVGEYNDTLNVMSADACV
jgi:hypothetical protein